MISHAFVNSSMRNIARLHAYNNVKRNVVFRLSCNDGMAQIDRTLGCATASNVDGEVLHALEGVPPLDSIALSAARHLRCQPGVCASRSNGESQLCYCMPLSVTDVQSLIGSIKRRNRADGPSIASATRGGAIQPSARRPSIQSGCQEGCSP